MIPIRTVVLVTDMVSPRLNSTEPIGGSMSELEQFRFFEFLNGCKAHETTLAAKNHYRGVHVTPESFWAMGCFSTHRELDQSTLPQAAMKTASTRYRQPMSNSR
jgi:hypothetical protein